MTGFETKPKPDAPSQRIAEIKLDSRSLTTSHMGAEIERHKAISDLIEDNTFILQTPHPAPGPYHLTLALHTDEIEMTVECLATAYQDAFRFKLSALGGLMRDYTILCDNFYKTARAGQIHKLETIDAGRRGVHDEAAETLIEMLAGKVTLDKPTARRLFTLIYVLQIRLSPTL